ncbi:hypothetical protein BEP19_03925 [Ammoniphilus oxalaticus]|uniref:Uncharacterized protein n=1 Tax=Ammoniphilus oxalaticus TaxID=66863 RepID=A0A419SLN2_9BACL|nr:endospore germination permease [Ammoniphilus oxalaticus]RKD24993.1 hypothetical protein BEP19_03925 [Ammoniphilus oxalaticus]
MSAIQQINHRQMSWLTASLILTGSLIGLPNMIMNVSQMDALFSQFMPLLYGLFICLIMYELAKQFPDKHLFEITFIVAGKWVGGFINGTVLIFMFIRLSAEMHAITGFINTTLLTRTPPEIIAFVFTIILIYYGRTSVEVIARVTDFFFPVLILGILLVFVATINEFYLSRVGPFLSEGISPVLKGNIISLTSYGEIYIMGAFLHMIPKAKVLITSIRHGVLLAALGFSLVILLSIGVLGSVISGRMMYPPYMVVEQIHITDFLDRVEIFFFSIWFPALAIKVVIIFLAILMVLSSFLGTREYKLYSMPVGLFVFVASFFTFQSPIGVLDFKSYAFPLLIPTIQLPVYLVVLGLAKWRKRQQQQRQKISDTVNIPKRIVRWGIWAHVFLLACFASIVTGLLLGSANGYIGRAATALYMIFLFGSYYCSRTQLNKLNQFTLEQEQEG